MTWAAMFLWLEEIPEGKLNLRSHSISVTRFGSSSALQTHVVAATEMNASCIRDVWAGTLEQEFAVIRRTIIDFPLVGLVRMSSSTFASELVDERIASNNSMILKLRT